MVCGAGELEWEAFTSGVFCFYARTYLRLGDEFDDEFLYARRVVHDLCRSQHYWMSYGTLRHALRRLQWKDPRDTVYAVRYLLRPSDRLLEFVPDYARPVGEVYQEDIATRLAVGLGDLSFLGTCELGSSSIAGLATWIPDWSSPMKYPWLIEPIWSACGWISAHAECISPGVLRVAGVSAARINKTQGMVGMPPMTLNGWHFDWALIIDTIKAFLLQSHLVLTEKYVGGGTLLEAYCLALHEGRTSENFAGTCGVALSITGAKETLMSIADMKHVPSQAEAGEDVEYFLSTTNQALCGRCFISTTEGYIGLAPAAAEPGDVVCVLLGMHVPVVLREMPTLGKWQVVGACCVPGLMWGEAITGNRMPHSRPVRYNAEVENIIDGHTVGMADSRDGSNKTNPAEMLKERGIEVIQYERNPHRLEVSADALREGGIDLRYFELV